MSRTGNVRNAARDLNGRPPAPVPMGDPGTVGRKADHIRINLQADVDAKGVDSGFEEYRFLHQALPELDLDAVDTSIEVLGRRLVAPLLISSMTGGTPEARAINRTLAEVAQARGLAMGLGSGRVLLEHPEVLDTFDVRQLAPGVLLLANLGAVQLSRGVTVDDCRRLVGRLGADALALHLNPLQEALQPEGDAVFGGLLRQIEALCRRLEVPVVVKEVGWGIAPDTVRRLLGAGVAAIDVAGAGGTSWSEVERHRIEDPVRSRVAAAFSGWGLPTAEALRLARRAAPDRPVFASGGVRTGLDVAKAVALGADLVGIAGPFLRAASEGERAADDLAVELAEVLRVAMFCVGAATTRELQRTPRLLRRGEELADQRVAQLTYRTSEAGEFIDITDDVADVLRASGARRGLVHVYSAHTTAAIRVNENEPLLLGDFRRFLSEVAPGGGYEHDDMSRRVGVQPDEPVNGHAHCQHLLLGASETLPIVDGRLALGRWQRLFLVELCSPRERQVVVQVLGA
ncbi:MAG TPA: type 2 isopentenyl-diphosphate Delta-isomerase [Candidatus Eisenbacteria bacterium]|nr:type 2 isopentenyl-diphosphate Delta-isomerase [Candidatus Eisenbacteria bacterium]